MDTSSQSQPVSAPESAVTEALPTGCPGHLAWTGGAVPEPSHEEFCDGGCQPFEAHPELAKWIERLANARIEGMSLEHWGDFLAALNRALATTAEMLATLRLVESVYRQNCVAPGEPSSVLDAIQAVIAKALAESARVADRTDADDAPGMNTTGAAK